MLNKDNFKKEIFGVKEGLVVLLWMMRRLLWRLVF